MLNVQTDVNNDDCDDEIWSFFVVPVLAIVRVVGQSFGSYGWSGEAPIFMDTRFHQIRAQTPMDPLRVKFRPSESDLEVAVDYGKKFARVVLGEKINERTGLYDYHAVPTFQPPTINQKTHN
jgi:hypothetical protein